MPKLPKAGPTTTQSKATATAVFILRILLNSLKMLVFSPIFELPNRKGKQILVNGPKVQLILLKVRMKGTFSSRYALFKQDYLLSGK